MYLKLYIYITHVLLILLPDIMLELERLFDNLKLDTLSFKLRLPTEREQQLLFEQSLSSLPIDNIIFEFFTITSNNNNILTLKSKMEATFLDNQVDLIDTRFIELCVTQLEQLH